ncbi:MAG: GDSL-type esterase/lipase family protein [Cyanobacteria bacterium J06600_6]
MIDSRSLANSCTPADRNLGHQLQVQKLMAQRILEPNVKGKIMFVGSSIFRLWTTLAKDMHPLPVINQAFGGSKTEEVLYYADDLIIPHQPKIVVYYCGSNDINAGSDAQGIQTRFALFVEYLATHLPNVYIFFVSINRAPQKQSKWHTVDAANLAIKQYAQTIPNVEFIDVNPALFDESDFPRYDLFTGDLVHLKPAAYEAFTKIIKPILQTTWERLS